MRSSNGTAGPTVDWREWVAFLGYVLAASVAISVALASVVLLLSTYAEDPQTSLGEAASARSPLPPSTVLRPRGMQPSELDLGSTARRERGPRAGSAAAPDETRVPLTAGAAGRPLGSTPVLPEPQRTEAAKASAAGPVPGSAAVQDTAASASPIGLPGSGDTTQGFAAIVQPIPEPSPTAASILQPLAPVLQPLGPSSQDTTLVSVPGTAADQPGAFGTSAEALSGT